MSPSFYLILGILSSLSAGGTMLIVFCKRLWLRVAGAILTILGLAALLMIMEIFDVCLRNGLFSAMLPLMSSGTPLML